MVNWYGRFSKDHQAIYLRGSMEEPAVGAHPVRRRRQPLALVAAAMCAFALLPASATAAYAGEGAVSGQERAQAQWVYQGTFSDSECHQIGVWGRNNKNWPYKCVWRPPLKYGYSELYFYI